MLKTIVAMMKMMRDTVEDEDDGDIASPSVANGNIIPSTNGIAYSNGIHQRKMAG